MASRESQTASSLPQHHRVPQSTEQEPLLGQRGDASQDEGGYLALNPFIGTGIIAEGGALLLLGIVWGGIFSHELIYPFGLHPLLNSAAIFLNLQGILVVQPTHTPTQKYRGAWIHSILNGTALLAFIGALIVIVQAHSGLQFKSPHAVMGLITYISVIGAALVGSVMFHTPILLGGEAKAKSFYKYHRTFGYVVLLMQLATVAAATQTPYVKNVINIQLWTVIFASVLVLIGVVPRIKRAKLGL